MARLTFHLILHTHWDREWYLAESGFRPRLVSTVGAVLDLLEDDATARFVLDGQTVLAEDVLDIRPEWINRTAAAVARGQLEIGPWYVLADELIPSGESLIRNLLQGARDAAALGGRLDLLYSPDAFGHPAILPTLAREFGIGAALLWRGLGQPARPDRDLHRWHGPDGSTLLLHHLPAQGYEIGADLAGPGHLRAARWGALRPQLVDRAATSHVAVFVGADHHAPPRDPGAMRDALQAIEVDHEVRISSIADFVAVAAADVAAVPTLSGELRWSYGYTWTLQGTFATRARLKRRHVGIELHMQRMVEPLTALSAWHGGDDRRGLLRHATRALLKCQFHDTLCGCCSDEVAREQGTRLAAIGAMNREMARATLHEMVGHDPDLAREEPRRITPALLLWNPLPRPRGGIVTAEVTSFRRDVLVGPPSGRVPRSGPGFTPFVLVTAGGERIPVQLLSVTPGTERLDAAHHYPDQDAVDRVRIAFDMSLIPGLGLVGMTPADGTASPDACGLEVRQRHLANRFVEIQVSRDGRVGLIDRRSGEHYLDILHVIDEPDQGDTYTPCIPPDQARSTSFHNVRCSVLAGGPLVGALDIRFTLSSAGRGEIAGQLSLILHADSPLLRVRLAIDNRAVDHRLRLRLPVGVGTTALAGAAFGFEHRESVRMRNEDFPAEWPMPTAPAHRYVAAGGEGRGLAVLSPGCFEYEWTDARELFITVLRSVGELSRDTLPARPGHAGWPMPTPDAQEVGHHMMELAVLPLGARGLEEPATLEQAWEEAFAAPQATFIRDFTGDLAAMPQIGAELQGRGLVFTALKPAEPDDGMVLRCYNSGTVPVTGRWIFRSSVVRAVLARADETPIHSLPVADQRVIAFEAPARGLVTVVVYPDE